MAEWDDEEEEFTAADEVLVDTDKITISIPQTTLRQIADTAAVHVNSVISRKIDKMIEKQISEIMARKLEAVMGEIAEKAATDWLLKPRQKFNSWGDPMPGTATSLADTIPDLVNNYLNQTVDSDGRVSSYSGDAKRSRLAQIVAKMVREPLDVEIKQAASKVSDLAKKVVADSVGKYVAEQLAPSIDAKTLLQQGQ